MGEQNKKTERESLIAFLHRRPKFVWRIPLNKVRIGDRDVLGYGVTYGWLGLMIVRRGPRKTP